MDNTGDITLDLRYADADVWCEGALNPSHGAVIVVDSRHI